MTELKTLKDLIGEIDTTLITPLMFAAKIRQEAIKWINEHDKKCNKNGWDAWEEFFNITERDLE